MNKLKEKLIPIFVCVGGGFCLSYFNKYFGLPLSHILQDFLILTFVVMGFWQKKTYALVLAVTSAFLLGLIELYSPQHLNNLLRGGLIIILLIFLIFWSMPSENRREKPNL